MSSKLKVESAHATQQKEETSKIGVVQSGGFDKLTSGVGEEVLLPETLADQFNRYPKVEKEEFKRKQKMTLL